MQGEFRQFWVDIDNIVNDITSHAYIFFVPAIAVLVFCMIGAICDTGKNTRRLTKFIDRPIKYRRRFRKRFYDIVHKIALSETGNVDGAELEVYEDAVYEDLLPLVFDKTDEQCFAKSFEDFLLRYGRRFRVMDFDKAVIKFRQFVELQREQQRIDEEALKDLMGRLSTIITTVQSKRTREYLIERRKATTKQNIVDAYNKQVKLIKANNGLGLMPVYESELQDSVIDYFKATVVISEQLLTSVFNCDYSEIDVPGCAIIYNTCTEQYLIAKSDRVYSKLESLMTGQSIDYAETFGADKVWGHIMLTRVVPLEKSGYDDLDELYQSLVKAYHCVAPFGYNVSSVSG